MNDLLVKTSGLDKPEVSPGFRQECRSEHSKVKTLMLLHGWGMNSHVWETIREDLESRYQIIWIDLPGHGFNRHLKAESLDNMVKLIAEVTPNNTHIMGWSLGGMVAQALAQVIPDRVNSLTLVTSTPRFSQRLLPQKWQYAMSADVLNRFAENLKQDTEKTLKGFIALQFIGVKDSKEALNNLIQHILFDNNFDSAFENESESCFKDDLEKKEGGVILRSISDGVVKAELEPQACNIPTQEALDVGLAILKGDDLRSHTPTCPEHWLFAEYDRLIPKEVINDLISLRPDAEITLIEKAGHAPFITHSEVFLKSMNDFIDTQPFYS